MMLNRCFGRQQRAATAHASARRSSHWMLSTLVVLLLLLGMAPWALLSPATVAAQTNKSINVRVFVDADRDGAIDTPLGNAGNDEVVNGVFVYLYNTDNQLVGLVATDSSSVAVFNNSPPGEYRVQVAEQVGVNAVVTVPGVILSQRTGFVTHGSVSDTQVDVGLRTLDGSFTDTGAPAGTRSIIVRVWKDEDANGIQDAGEGVFPSLPVEIYRVATTTTITSTTTNADGYAVFTDTTGILGPGYALRIRESDIPAGYVATRSFVEDGALDDGRDSNALFVDEAGQTFIKADLPGTSLGANVDDVDIGFSKGGINGHVWRDLDRDGILDRGGSGLIEPYLNAVQVSLYDKNRALVDSMASRAVLDSGVNEAGFYEFKNLDLTKAPFTVVISSTEFQSDDTLYGAANSTNTAPSLEQARVIDGGDLTLYDSAPGEGVVGTDDAVAIKVSLGTVQGSTYSGVNDIGFYQGSIGNYVWFDLDRDGVIDDGTGGGFDERTLGINDVTVFIDDGRGGGTADNGILDGTERSTVTAVNNVESRGGYYSFPDLPLSASGISYPVVISATEFLSGGDLYGYSAFTDPPDLDFLGNGALRFTSDQISASAPNLTNVNFGITRADIGNVVFDDLDGDGVKDVGDPGVENVVVNLYAASAPSTVVVSDTTDATGTYTLPLLPAGQYFAAFDLDANSLDSLYRGSPLATSTYTGTNPLHATPDENDLAATGADRDPDTNPATRIYHTATFTLTAGRVHNGVDAALYRPVTLSGHVFFEDDQAPDGLDNGDIDMEDVPVRVRHFGPDGAAGGGDDLVYPNTGSITTDVTGNYTFTTDIRVPPGVMRVEFQSPDADAYAPATMSASLSDASNEAIDSDVKTDAAYAGYFVSHDATVVHPDGTNAGSQSNVDAGYSGTGTVSARAFVDKDADGVDDDTNNDLEGAKVDLSNFVFVAFTNTYTITGWTATTVTTGTAEFTGLPDGTFSLAYTAPSATPDYTRTYSDVNEVSAPTLDSDGDGPSGTADRLTGQSLANATAGQVATASRSVGFWQPFTLEGKVFFDSDQDDKDDGTEPGVAKVQVQVVSLGSNDALDDPNPADTDPTTDITYTVDTISDGTYDFSTTKNMRPGPYKVIVGDATDTTYAQNFAFVTPDVGQSGADPATDSDVTPLSAGADVAAFTASDSASNDTADDVDAGLTGDLAVRGVAWEDTDGDGTRDETDYLDGVTATVTHTVSVPGYLTDVTLPARTGTTIASNGTYTVTGLPSGTFTMSFSLPTGYTRTWDDVGEATNDLLDSDGLRVELVSPQGEDRLDAQTLAAPTDEVRSQGYFKGVTVGGSVWFDQDNDAVRDTGEAAMTGFSVDIVSAGLDGDFTTAADNVTDTVDLDATGVFTSDGTPALPPGDLHVQVTNPDDDAFAFVATTSIDQDITSIDGLVGTTSEVNLTSDGEYKSYEIGFTGATSIAGALFLDDEADGLQTFESVADTALPAGEGVTVTLTFTETSSYIVGTAELTRDDVVDNDAYSFGALPGGSYALTFTPAEPAGEEPYVATFADVDGGDGVTDYEEIDSDGNLTGTLTAGTNLALDQGFYQEVKVTARVFVDEKLPLNNIWGYADAPTNTDPEAGLINSTVVLSITNVPTGTASLRPTLGERTIETTDQGAATGLVTFTVPPGTYTLESSGPKGYLPTVGNDESESLGALASGATSLTQSAPNGTTNVFGYVEPVTISGVAWFSRDGNNVLDTGDPPMQNVDLVLLNYGPDEVVGGTDNTTTTLTTDTDGGYTTDGLDLLPGKYTITFTNPSTVDFSFITTGTDSDVNSSGATTSFDVATGGSATKDAGFVGTRTVSGSIFEDQDGDGFSYESQALNGATVALTHTVEISVGTPLDLILSTTITRTVDTKSSASYSFAGLPSGGLELVFTPPTVASGPSWAPTTQDATAPAADDAADSDGSKPGARVTATFNASGGDADYDQGFYKTATITGRAFFDQDRTNDANLDNATPEPGMRGVVVRLMKGKTEVTTTTTELDTTGTYTFTDVDPYTYTLEFEALTSEGFAFVTANSDTSDTPDSGLDSDVLGADGLTAEFVAASGATVSTIDAGYVGTGTLEGLVFEDKDGSDTQTSGDTKLASATVTVTVEVNNDRLVTTLPITELNTTAVGAISTPNYSLTGLPAGQGVTYTLTFTAPTTSYAASTADQGSDDTLDSDGPTATLTSTVGVTTDADQGYYLPVTVKGRAFYDTDGDDLDETPTAEPGMRGVQVQLLRGGATAVQTQTTELAATAAYTFTDVKPGPYTVVFDTLPGEGYAFVAAGDVPTDTLASAVTITTTGATDVFSITSNVAVDNINAGYIGTGTLEGLVFEDKDGSDTQTSGDTKLASATVTVTVEVNNDRLVTTLPITELNTTAVGAISTPNYSLTGLPAGQGVTYTLTFTAPTTSYAASTADQGSDDTLDSDGPTVTLMSTVGVTTDADQGYYLPVTITGRAFFDQDLDNLDETPTAEPGMKSVGVRLRLNDQSYTQVGSAASTDTTGVYTFTSVKPSEYVVDFDSLTGFGFVTPNVGSDDTIDSDVTGVTSGLGPQVGGMPLGYTDPFTVTSNQTLADVDGGYKGVGVVSGTVFLDEDGSDTQTTGDKLLPTATAVVTVAVDLTNLTIATPYTVTASLLNPADETDLSQATYQFSGLPVGYGVTYTLDFTPPEGAYTASTANQGTDDIDSDGPSVSYSFPSGSTVTGLDFDQGYWLPTSVGGRAFFDQSQNALDDAEPAMAGLEMTLWKGATSITTTTSATGVYTFTELKPGSYEVQFEKPAGFAFVAADQDSDDTIDSDVTDTATGKTSSIAVKASEESKDVDAGYVGTGTITGLTFKDRNGDGLSTSEDPLPGATVTMTLVVNTATLSTTIITTAVTTDTTGVYSFTTLPGGSFSLEFAPPTATPPWILTLADAAASADSDGADLTGTLDATGPAIERDQGYYQSAIIVARLFNEQVSVNNAFQEGEVGFESITVEIDPEALASTSPTTASGLVTFTVVPSTTAYTLSPTTPSGYLPSPGQTFTVTVASGDIADIKPFGYYKLSSITGTVWFDSDKDGLRDAGEPGMEGIDVELKTITDTFVVSASSDVDGTYGLTGVVPNGGTGAPTSYKLCFGTRTGFKFTESTGDLDDDGNSDAGLGTGCTGGFTIGSDSTLTTLDAGYIGTYSIGDRVWNDLDGDGLQDADEPHLAGAVITLAISTTDVINSNDPTVTMTVTSTETAMGVTGMAPAGAMVHNAILMGVPPATGYRVASVTRPTGYVPTVANAGDPNDDTVDSDAVGDSYTLASPANVRDLDFGFYGTTTVGDLVWLDHDGDGAYDAGSEPGIAGVQVDLLDGTGVLSTTVTSDGASLGSYSFESLEPGTYSLRFTTPAGYAFTERVGSIDDDDDNDAGADGTTAEFTLASRQVRTGVDAGIRGQASISGMAWLDDNNNRVRDSSDTRRLGSIQVIVTIVPDLAPGTVVTATTTTASDGSYSLANLPAGMATVRFIAPSGYASFASGDSDGPLATVKVVAGAAVADLDQGYIQIGRKVFLPIVVGESLRPELTTSFKVTPASPRAFSPASIEVTITNTGEIAASHFWVDLYINPSKAPAVNEPWNEVCGMTPCYGMAWFFEGTLAPGQSAVLSSVPQSAANPLGYEPDTSVWPGSFFAGTSRLYAMVDSWNRDETGDVRSTTGALRELNEGNNLAVQDLTVTVGEPLTPVSVPQQQDLRDLSLLRYRP